MSPAPAGRIVLLQCRPAGSDSYQPTGILEMNQLVVVVQLREIAARMRHASIALRDKPYELKKTARYLGQQAATMLFPILKNSGASPMAPLWQKDWLIGTLRNQLQYFHGFDGDAFRRKPTVIEHPDSLDTSEDETQFWRDHEAGQLITSPNDLIYEGEMLRAEIADFYFDQTEHWANMLELVADRLVDRPEVDSPEQKLIKQQLEKIHSTENKKLFIAMLKFNELPNGQQHTYESLFRADETAFRLPPNGNTKHRLHRLKESFMREHFEVEAGNNGWNWIKRPKESTKS